MMTTRIIGIVCIALLAVIAATPASAALLAYEGFDYTAGNLAGGNGGSGWEGAWTAKSGSTQVTSGSLTSAASPFASVGNKIQGVDAGWDFISRKLAADSIDMDTDASLYTSFLLRLDTSQPLGTPAALNKFDTSPIVAPDIAWVGSTGHQKKVALASDVSGTNLTAGTTYFVVAKLTGTVDPANDFMRANYYLPTDTVPATEPDPLDWDVIKNGEDRTGVVREIITGLLHSGGNMDELRYGETWADVAAIPEPSSISIVLMGLISFVGYGRRR